jgi:hypothetical protein
LQKKFVSKGWWVIPGCATLIFGIVLILCLSLTFSASSLNTLECQKFDRTQVRCKLTNFTFLKREAVYFQLYMARLEYGDIIPASGERTNRVSLITSNGNIPLTKDYEGSNRQYIIEKVNSFIAESEESSLSIQDNRFMPFVFGLFGFFAFSIVSG